MNTGGALQLFAPHAAIATHQGFSVVKQITFHRFTA
jgi:hypothetical protein